MKLLLLLALLTLAALSPAARGDMVHFAYSWGFGETYLSASGQGPINLSSSLSPDGSTFAVDHGSGVAALTLASPGTAVATPGDSPVTLPVGTLAATAGPGPAGDFSYSANANLTLRLTDLASGESGELSLAASIFGKVGPEGSEAGAYGWTTPGAEGLLLGGHWYVAGFGADGPDPLSAGGEPVPFQVSIFLDPVDFSPIDPMPLDGSPAQTPEPSALLLGASAAVVFGMRTLRRGRR